MAEWLGTALQKLLQRFESASDLQETTDIFVGRFCLWYAGWRGVDDSHVVWGATIVCKPPCCTPHATASCRATSGRCALLTFGNRVAGIDVLMARKARLKEVSPRVRAKALTSNLASDLQERLTFLSVVFCFFEVWLFKPHSPKKAVTSWCKPHRPAFFCVAA